MISIEFLLLLTAILILLSILLAKVFDNIGVPTLILFIGVGMLAGSEGIGGIYFDDAVLAQSIGIIALIFILFSGGLDTNWKEVKHVIKPAAAMATVGVLLTAVIVGVFVAYLLDVSLLWGILLGSIISSTDAAAVFSIIRSRSISLKGSLKPLLELESGSNDPMAVFLTIGTIQLLINPEQDLSDVIILFVLQMGIGAVSGIVLGKAMVFLINRLKFSAEGIYPVFSISMCVLTYAITALVGGS
ncbi:MAG: cation:proton antiporter, partial [Ignavibacteriaceae bacterium]